LFCCYCSLIIDVIRQKCKDVFEGWGIRHWHIYR
jgi:hypothetical protein